MMISLSSGDGYGAGATSSGAALARSQVAVLVGMGGRGQEGRLRKLLLRKLRKGIEGVFGCNLELFQSDVDPYFRLAEKYAFVRIYTHTRGYYIRL